LIAGLNIMELKDLEEIVDNIILQHDYPGYEPRSLNVALPQAITEAPVRLYRAALASSNVFVQLLGLRWFQTKLGAAKSCANPITAQLENADAWVRLEAIRTIDKAKLWNDGSVIKVSSLLKDPDEIVRMEAAKACGRLPKSIFLQEKVIPALKEASQDSAQSVRRKAIKSLRKLGVFSNP
jgi:HEAT repeats